MEMEGLQTQHIRNAPVITILSSGTSTAHIRERAQVPLADSAVTTRDEERWVMRVPAAARDAQAVLALIIGNRLAAGGLVLDRKRS